VTRGGRSRPQAEDGPAASGRAQPRRRRRRRHAENPRAPRCVAQRPDRGHGRTQTAAAEPTLIALPSGRPGRGRKHSGRRPPAAEPTLIALPSGRPGRGRRQASRQQARRESPRRRATRRQARPGRSRRPIGRHQPGPIVSAEVTRCHRTIPRPQADRPPGSQPNGLPQAATRRQGRAHRGRKPTGRHDPGPTASLRRRHAARAERTAAAGRSAPRAKPSSFPPPAGLTTPGRADRGRRSGLAARRAKAWRWASTRRAKAERQPSTRRRRRR
jgi:hypothetical protein